MEAREYKVRECTLELLETKTPLDARRDLDVGEKIYTGKMVLGPSVGTRFHFYRDDAQEMYTSTVKNVRYIKDDELEITTRNSRYSLKIGKTLNSDSQT